MFSSTEFVEEWNQIFSFKIKESDLAKPTETFVFNALINYLKMFNFDTTPMIQMKNSENITERRSFLIQFCNYIDHIYKISDKSHCFVYYDLKHPSPKKTVHMLNHLLNYFFYFNMFKESIVPVANAKIRERQNLIDDINKYRFEYQQNQIRAQNIEKCIKNYRKLAPETLNQLKEIFDQEAKQKDVIAKLEKSVNEYNDVVESLREKEARLKLKVVSKEEVDRLQYKKSNLRQAIADQEAIVSSTYAKTQERSAAVNNLQTTIANIDNAKQLNSAESLQIYKEYFLKYKDLEEKFYEISRKKEELKTINIKLEEDLKNIEKGCVAKSAQLKETKVSGEKKIGYMKNLLEANEAASYDLEHELHITDKQLEDEKNVTEDILELANLLVRGEFNDSIEN